MIFGFDFQRDEVSFSFLLSHPTALSCIAGVDHLCHCLLYTSATADCPWLRLTMVILKCGHGIGITSKQKDRPARLLLMNGLESYSVLLAALEWSAVRFGLRWEPQKDSCKAAQGKCSFPWDGICLLYTSNRAATFH